MQVYKFGGASVKDAEAVKNVAAIINQYARKPLVVVVSAMAKTTNALELVLHHWVKQRGEAQSHFSEIMTFHRSLAKALFGEIPERLRTDFEALEVETELLLSQPAPQNYGAAYDSLVHKGELLSTIIIAEYLRAQNVPTQWLDARQLIITNKIHRRATVDWIETSKRIGTATTEAKVFVIQGFIGATADGVPTTLGREGSDYTAAVLASTLNATAVSIWKDVPGVLNGDPKVFDDTVLLEEISYREAIELAYYGASVIHPKTIQPLREKNIPLYVRSFVNPQLPGTVIGKGLLLKPLISCYIRKTNQLMLSVATRDLAFIVETNLQHIYGVFAKHGITVNLMQNSAISSSFCINHDGAIVPEALKELAETFDIKVNENVSLYTIRHYNSAAQNAVVGSKKPLLEQITRQTYQVVLAD